MKTNYLIVLTILSVVGCSPTDQGSAPRPREVGNPSNLLEAAELVQASAVEKRLQGLPKSGPAEDLAKVIAEVDEWTIAPKEEEKARTLIDAAVEELRARITSEVTALTKAAVSAPKGKDAADQLSRINMLLTLYPVPRTETQRKSLEEISSIVLATSRRVEDIRRLRYNAWSVEQVRNGMETFRLQTSGIRGTIKPDKDALLKTCSDYLRYLDSSFLEPAVMNLYAEFLRRCDAEMDDDRKVNLARALVDPSLQRYTPSDF